MIVLTHLRVRDFKRLRFVDLAFPRQGSVLIEGLNEAGKSTLFEAVYFALYGRPLVTEAMSGSFDTAIRYGADAALVELGFASPFAAVVVTRTLRRGKPSQARLVVRRADGGEERVQGVRAVNQRVLEALGGLDGDALLNSCFVEQKKLEKLESLSKEDRLHTLLRLLNLDRFVALEERFRVRRDDEQALAQAQARAELAALRASLPRLEAERASVEARLDAIALQRAVEASAEQRRVAEVAERRLTALQDRWASLEPWLEGPDRGPELARRVAEMGEVLPEARSALAQALVAAETMARTEERERARRELDLLDAWLRSDAVATALRERGERLERAREAVEQAERTVTTARRAVREATLRLVGALGLALLGVALALAAPATPGLPAALAVVAGGALGGAALGARGRGRASAKLRRALQLRAEGAAALARVVAEMEVARDLGDDGGGVARAAQELRLLGREAPRDRAEALARRAALAREWGWEGSAPAQADVEAAARAARQAWTQALGALQSVVAQHLGEWREERRQALERAAACERAARALLAERGPGMAEAGAEAGEGRWPPLDEVEPSAEGALRARRDEFLAELGAVRQRIAALEDRWQLAGVPLDPAACQEEAERLARDLAVRRLAAEIVAGARERLVQRVLPSTERNLRLLLPQLTNQRYRDARISEDYRIEVWDEEAGRYVAKNVFSGGARDQFSLALRLAFAVATLPQELGVAPGFLFLDEPLSSFDGPRTRALVDLLTAGHIARSFAQVFVISHGRSFDPGAFRYRLLLADGRVVEHDLPPLQG